MKNPNIHKIKIDKINLIYNNSFQYLFEKK
jgi:hypothetical protein